MIQYKKSANKNALEPVMMLALSRVEKIYNEFGYSAVVTSTNDSFHKKGSLHYVGLAVDIRIRHIQQDLVQEINRLIKEKLTSYSNSFQVILEPDHIHIEYDRRKYNA